MKKANNCFISLNCLLFKILIRKSMFAVLHSDINSLKAGLLHLTGQLMSSAAKVKGEIRNLSHRNYLIDRHRM
jgi:hypothetical protein